MRITLPIVTALALAACSKSDKDTGAAPVAKPAESKPGASAPAAEPVKPAKPTPKAAAGDMAKLQVDKNGWDGDFNVNLKSWTYEKYTPAGDGSNTPNRFYIDVLPDDAPVAADDYAAKLGEKDWQDFGFEYSEIQSKDAIPDGFLIKGAVKETTDPNAKPEPGFVMVRDLGGTKVRCKSGGLVSDKLRDEAVAVCRSAKL